MSFLKRTHVPQRLIGLSLGSEWANQQHQCLHHPVTADTLQQHEAVAHMQPRSNCTSMWSHTRSEDLIVVPLATETSR